MNDSLQDLMRAATRLTQSGHLQQATAAIQRALGRALPAGERGNANADRAAGAQVLDGCVFERDPGHAPTAPGAAYADAGPGAAYADAAPGAACADAAPGAAAFADEAPGAGAFTSGSHSQAQLTRAYKLYVPPGAAGRALPLVVMLHGCTQDPDDFAAGTAMNERAREQGFLVLYPAQSQDANPSRCWNWFKHNHQQRGRGEPAVLAGMTQAVMQQHGIDPRRVYIAGLSAGGAMAAIVAALYPEIFAAVGVHSGLAHGAASNLPDALAVMRTGAGTATAAAGRVPTIVFHGDADRTVHPRNGEQVIAAARRGSTAASQVEQAVCRQGRRHTRSSHPADAGGAATEHWLLHGAGHAWSGGQAAGSYTDAKGPDATREMLRFFFAHPQAPQH